MIGKQDRWKSKGGSEGSRTGELLGDCIQRMLGSCGKEIQGFLSFLG